MKPKNCLIFGGSGQIGRHLVRKLTKNDVRVTVVTRNIHQKSYIIKTQGNAGYIDIVEANIYEEQEKPGNEVAVTFSLGINRWKGREYIQLMVEDIFYVFNFMNLLFSMISSPY